jgi:hypothetical protein
MTKTLYLRNRTVKYFIPLNADYYFFFLNVKFENLMFLIHILIVGDVWQVSGFPPQIKLTTTI